MKDRPMLVFWLTIIDMCTAGLIALVVFRSFSVLAPVMKIVSIAPASLGFDLARVTSGAVAFVVSFYVIYVLYISPRMKI